MSNLSEIPLPPPQPADPSTATATPTINIGTRRSILARKQTEIVEKKLKEAWPERTYETHAMATMGDKNQVTALHDFNAKSLWTHELEELLERGKLDMIVHSLKDMPTQLPDNLSIGAILAREDPRDAFVLSHSLTCLNDPKYHSISTLPPGSLIGTSSVRRAAQLKRAHPHLRFADVRGNVGTRLAKLDGSWKPTDESSADDTSKQPEAPQFTALILAAAGLIRLGLESRITSFLSKSEGGMLHAVGQGAIGVEVRTDDRDIRTLLSRVGCERTTRACIAERSLMRTLEGGCSVPIGVETEWVKVDTPTTATQDPDAPLQEDIAAGAPEPDEELVMRAVVVSVDGSEAAEAELQGPVGSRAMADEFGWKVAQALVSNGAGRILEKITLDRRIVEEQGGA
ncbi:porphobilinogen deaminase [Saccharata proteae CBS 121410]|uniref:Porphobilinogen deaminase n=1 Tax=Saccharata proteae CBS 121410 TaxID=1314787 RepID=A0A9P4HXP8_9PEZI|nr:porphobilinogen deaminase [Saccharata proteae CBS 121410]